MVFIWNYWRILFYFLNELVEKRGFKNYPYEIKDFSGRSKLSLSPDINCNSKVD